MLNKWFSTKKEIEKWIDQKLHMFETQENRNPWLSKEEWLKISLYTDKTKDFFYFFPCELHEWLSRLANSQGMWRLDDPIVWTPQLVRHMETLENNIMRAIDHQVDHILGGFFCELVIDMTIKYSEAKHRFLKGLQGKYLKSMKTWIKMLLWEKRVIPLT